MQEVMLIAKYFGTLQPVAQQALRTLPHVASQMASSMTGEDSRAIVVTVHLLWK